MQLEDECSQVQPKLRPWGILQSRFSRPEARPRSRKSARIVDRSFPTEVFEPARDRQVGSPRGTIRAILREHLCLKSKTTTHLKDLWNDADARRSLPANQLGSLALSLEPAGRGFAHHEFRRRKYELQARAARSIYWPPVRVLAVKGSGGDLGSITEVGFALLYLDRLEQLKELYRGEAVRRRDGPLLSAFGVWREPRRGFDRHSSARVSPFCSRGSSAPGLGYRSGGKRQRKAKAGRVQ